MQTLILFGVIVISGTGGELCVSRGMKRVGEAASFRPAEMARMAMRALREPWMWTGVGMMALAFFALLGAFSRYNVSFVVPVTALDYVAATFGAVVFLHERVVFQRWIGVLLVAAGVVLVIFGKS